jgi:hypothetical protein
VIHRLVHPLPREFQARLPQLTRVGGPRRFGGGLTQKPCENPNLPGMLWVGTGMRSGDPDPMKSSDEQNPNLELVSSGFSAASSFSIPRRPARPRRILP